MGVFQLLIACIMHSKSTEKTVNSN